MLTDLQIRNAIKQKIQEGLNLHYTGANPPVDVRLYNRWVLKDRRGQSAALLRAISGRDDGKVHCWMIGTSSIERTRADMHGKTSTGFAMTGSLKKKGPDRRDVVKRYKIYSFQEYNFGTDPDPDAVNSENEIVQEFEAVSDYLSKYPTLGLSDPMIQGHLELQAEEIDIFEYGEITANVVIGYIDVVMFRTV